MASSEKYLVLSHLDCCKAMGRFSPSIGKTVHLSPTHRDKRGVRGTDVIFFIVVVVFVVVGFVCFIFFP